MGLRNLFLMASIQQFLNLMKTRKSPCDYTADALLTQRCHWQCNLVDKQALQMCSLAILSFAIRNFVWSLQIPPSVT